MSPSLVLDLGSLERREVVSLEEARETGRDEGAGDEAGTTGR